MPSRGRYWLYPYLCSGMAMTFIGTILTVSQNWILMSIHTDEIEIQKSMEDVQLKLHNEWQNHKFIKEVFVTDASQGCQVKNADAEPLFTYDWYGMLPLY